jgi:hypothetical protein
MAGIDLVNTAMGVVPTAGVHLQVGEFTNSGDGTVFVPTQFTSKVWGVAYGDLTDAMGGYANSICEGPTIRFRMADSTGSAGITYIAFGY